MPDGMDHLRHPRDRMHSNCRCMDIERSPIQAGDYVKIPKGTLVSNLRTGEKAAGRTYTVRVNHILSGAEYQDGADGPTVINPSVCWDRGSKVIGSVHVTFVATSCHASTSKSPWSQLGVFGSFGTGIFLIARFFAM